MSEHEVSRPVNGQVYRDHFEAIDWDKKCDTFPVEEKLPPHSGYNSEGGYFHYE